MAGSNSRTNSKAWSSRWVTIETSLKELLQTMPSVIKAEQLGGENEHLRKRLDEKIKESESEKSARQQLLQDVGVKFDEWNREVVAIKQERKNLKEKNEQVESRQVQNLEREVQSLRSSLKSREAELSESSALLTGKTEHLRQSQNALEAIKAIIGVDDLGKEISEQLALLNRNLRSQADKYFYKVFPPGVDVDDIFTQLSYSQFMHTLRQPIPISNSDASRCLRPLAVEAIVSTKVSDMIFQNFYLPQTSDSNIIKEASARLQSENSRKEAIFNVLLRTAFTVEEDEQERDAVSSVRQEILGLVDPLLLEQSEKDGFRDEIGTLLETAAQVWRMARKNSTTIEAFTQINDLDWGLLKSHEQEVELTPEQMASAPSAAPIMVLFPQILSHDGDGPLHPGCALSAHQSLVVAGKSEFQEQATRVGVKANPEGGNTKRRQSFHMPGGSIGSHRRTISSASSSGTATASKSPKSPTSARSERRRPFG